MAKVKEAYSPFQYKNIFQNIFKKPYKRSQFITLYIISNFKNIKVLFFFELEKNNVIVSVVYKKVSGKFFYHLFTKILEIKGDTILNINDSILLTYC